MSFTLRTRAPTAWLTLACGLLGAVGLTLWAVERTGPAGEFSQVRARAVVDHLSETIGVRLNGTPAHRQAAEYLVAELRKIPGLEVELQEVGGTHVFSNLGFPPFVYRTLNVVARLPGRAREAVLLDAHFDTMLDSVGAADDAAGVAAVVETLRVLAAGPPLAHTVVANLNGAEEIGLLGAAGFLQHRWAKDVRAYVYAEALPGGTAGLFGAGPGNVWLAQAFARAVPRPFGTSVGQDLVRAKLLPHNGDFTPFHEAGIPGLDIAMTRDGWAYHTMLDRSRRLRPASLQHLGDSVLAVTRQLASAPLPAIDRGPGAVFYDFLGFGMAAYSTRTARGLAVLALLLTGAALFWARRQAALSLREAMIALGWIALATLAGLLAAVLAGALIAFGVRRPLGWFATPSLAVIAFGAPAAAGVLAVHAWWRRRERPPSAPAALAGGILLWGALLALAALGNVGAGYLALHWVLGGTLALVLAVRGAPLPAQLGCVVVALLLTLEVATLFLAYFLPITGMLGLPGADLLVAALVALPVVLGATLTLPALHAHGGFGRVAVGLGAVGVVGLALVAARFPYTEARAKRVNVTHTAEGENGAVRIRWRDRIGVAALDSGLARDPGARWATPGNDPFTRERPAPAPPMPAPRAQIEAREDLPDGNRRVTLKVLGTSPLVRLAIPKAALLAWSLAPALTPPIDGRYMVQLYALPAAGTTMTLTLRGRAPVSVELRGTDGVRPAGPEVAAALAALPPWVTATVNATRITRLDL